MRILWTTNEPLPAVQCYYGRGEIKGSGGWMGALLSHLKRVQGLELAVVCATNVPTDTSFTEDGVTYFVIAQRRYFPEYQRKMLLEKFAGIVQGWKPDLIHIHGSERFYGLLAERPDCQVPMLITIQGILCACASWHNTFGTLSISQLLAAFSLWETVTLRGVFSQWLLSIHSASIERRIYRAVRNFGGRTRWDRAWLRLLAPQARYFSVGEILRDEFYHHHWRLENCRPYQIIFTNAGHPRRGTDVLLEAVGILRQEFPDISLCLVGQIPANSRWGRTMQRKLTRLGGMVRQTGALSAAEIANELCNSHVFVLPSFIENSPNSLCEAQLLGLPTVASHVGGVSTLVEAERDGLLFPAGDAPLLAEQIARIFRDNDLARRLGQAAAVIAHQRHDPKTVVEQLTGAYSQILVQEGQ